MPPVPKDLQDILQGQRVAIVGNRPPQNPNEPPPYQPAPGERCCKNCGYRPGGKICQVDPPRAQAILVPAQGGASVMSLTLFREPPDSYWCPRHRYENELEVPRVLAPAQP